MITTASIQAYEPSAILLDYLIPIPGLHAQRDALAVLRQRTAALNSTASFKSRLLDDLDRHERRLSERPV